jgi:flagellar motor switch protein FliN
MSEEWLNQEEIAKLVRCMQSTEPVDEGITMGESDIQINKGNKVDARSTTAQVRFVDVVPPDKVDPLGNIHHLGHVSMELEIVLGEATLTVGELISLDKDSVIPLRKLAGDNAQILANGRAVAEGEIVVLNDRFAFRVHSVDDKKKTATRQGDIPAARERDEEV